MRKSTYHKYVHKWGTLETYSTHTTILYVQVFEDGAVPYLRIKLEHYNGDWTLVEMSDAISKKSGKPSNLIHRRITNKNPEAKFDSLEEVKTDIFMVTL